MMNFKCVPAAFGLALLCLSLPASPDGTGESASTPSLTGLELYSGAALKDEPERKVRLDTGGKAALKADVPLGAVSLDLILSGGLPYTELGELGGTASGESGGTDGVKSGGTDGGLSYTELVRRFGVSFNIDIDSPMDVPCLSCSAGLYCGTLRFAGGLSRLKKPCLSAPWNYGSISLLSQGLAAGLPSFTSAETPLALAAVFRPSGGSSFLPAVELAVTREGEAYASVYTDLPVPFSRSSLVSLACNAGSFVYGGRELKSWFYKEPYYRERRYLSADAELGFRLEKYMSANLAAGFTENPHGGLDEAFFWRRGQAALSYGILGLTASHFFAERPEMILPGGSCLNQRSRLSVNPSVKLPVRFPGLSAQAGTLSLALLGMRDEKLKDGVEQEAFTVGGKAGWKFRRLSLSGQYTDSFPGRAGEELPDEGLPHVRKLGISVSYRGILLRTSSSLSLRREGEKDTLSFSQKLYPVRSAVSSVSLGGSSVMEEGKLAKLTVSAGAVFLFHAGHTNIRGKLLYSSTFCGEF